VCEQIGEDRILPWRAPINIQNGSGHPLRSDQDWYKRALIGFPRHLTETRDCRNINRLVEEETEKCIPQKDWKPEDIPMRLVEVVEAKTEALRVRDVAQILGFSVQQIYKMAAQGQMPSIRIASAVRFDPQEFATWLKTKYPVQAASPVSRLRRSA